MIEHDVVFVPPARVPKITLYGNLLPNPIPDSWEDMESRIIAEFVPLKAHHAALFSMWSRSNAAMILLLHSANDFEGGFSPPGIPVLLDLKKEMEK